MSIENIARLKWVTKRNKYKKRKQSMLYRLSDELGIETYELITHR